MKIPTSHSCTSASLLGLQSTPNPHFLLTYLNFSTTFAANSQVLVFRALSRLHVPSSRYIFPCQFISKWLTICATRSNIAIPWSNFFHKHSTTSLMCSADYKRELILHLCQGLTTLMAVRVNDSLELEVTDPKDDQGDVEQEDGKS